jgi:hypothetical protein
MSQNLIEEITPDFSRENHEWLDEEAEQLFDELKSGQNIYNICRQHKRSINSVNAFLENRLTLLIDSETIPRIKQMFNNHQHVLQLLSNLLRV